MCSGLLLVFCLIFLHSLLHLGCSSLMSLLKVACCFPVPGPLHMLFLLPGTLLSQHLTWMVTSSASGLRLDITFSEKTSPFLLSNKKSPFPSFYLVLHSSQQYLVTFMCVFNLSVYHRVLSSVWEALIRAVSPVLARRPSPRSHLGNIC